MEQTPENREKFIRALLCNKFNREVRSQILYIYLVFTLLTVNAYYR